jgi:hypothetical protein
MTRDKASEGSAGPGSPMTPDDLPDEATPADRAKSKAAPIGRPVSREQFEKLYSMYAAGPNLWATQIGAAKF